MSKDTRNVPALRFKGFSDAWEKRKFGELYSKTSEKNDGSFGPDKIISVATMSWKTNVRISNEGYLATYNVLRKGDIAFEGNRSKKFSFGRFVENDIGDGIVSHVFVVFRPKVPPVISYWKYFIHNEFVMRNILRKSTIKATMMTNLSSHDFLRQTLCTPSFKEQENIGNFLERLDSLIAATQSKLSSLETLKKALLQGLFI
ncbi:restriction endonuclease subunit S [Lacticaseibacillus rhamnosus]|uniref:restriction endonuclease subunit S n=1 Tax=Lacticaseibacillus rhamnosus TaxID=47715 RepID=UPI001CDA8ADB|nr:restriction endonuclease subunit S [Lacticaseibacillus rhamnosus]